MEASSILKQVAQPRERPNHQWSIRRVMVLVALTTPLLALARHPFAFGLVAYGGSTALLVGLSIRRRRYDLVSWLLILYPLLPLGVLYLHWSLATRRIVRRSSPLFEGLIGLSDVCGFLCLFAYVACVSILANRRGDPELRRAAKRVVIVMPIAWVALFFFAMWDPFGMLGYFFR